MTVFLFGPYEYILSNYKEFWFSFRTIWWCYAILFVAAFILLAVIGVSLRGKLLNIYVSALFAVTFALYLQGNFINIDYGQLTGEEIRWERYGGYSIFNTGLWLVMLITPLIVLYFSRKVWTRTVQMISTGVVLVQIVTVATLVITNPNCIHNSTTGVGFSWDGTNMLSGTENTIVLLLDECDVAYINEQRMHDEHCTDFLTGFTFYPDTVGVYNMTYPAVTQYFTGQMWYMDKTVAEYNKEAWQKNELFAGMRARDYDIRILGGQKDFAMGDMSLIDNAAIEDPKITSYPGLTSVMMQLVAFRYLPHCLKSGMWTPAEELDRFLETGDLYHINDASFYQLLLENPITAGRTEPAFRFLHLNGMHIPFSLDETVSEVGPDTATSYSQGRALLHILERITTQMKEAGVYDNSSIIIVADHGKRESRLTEVTQPHNPVLMIKPRNSETPFRISFQPMWTTNMKATMMDAVGLSDYADYGYSMLRPEDCPEVVRYFYPVVTADSQNELVEYEITGEATYMNVWRKTGQTGHLGTEYFDD